MRGTGTGGAIQSRRRIASSPLSGGLRGVRRHLGVSGGIRGCPGYYGRFGGPRDVRRYPQNPGARGAVTSLTEHFLILCGVVGRHMPQVGCRAGRLVRDWIRFKSSQTILPAWVREHNSFSCQGQKTPPQSPRIPPIGPILAVTRFSGPSTRPIGPTRKVRYRRLQGPVADRSIPSIVPVEAPPSTGQPAGPGKHRPDPARQPGNRSTGA